MHHQFSQLDYFDSRVEMVYVSKWLVCWIVCKVMMMVYLKL